MSRSSGILYQMQQRRTERKKPKINAKLKKTSIDNNQIGGIATAQENKPPPITMQKTGGRNSVAMTFSIGLHVAIAILLGALYIKEQIIPPNELFAGDVVPEINQRERPIVKVRDRVKFETQQEKIENPIQRAPVPNANIPQTPGDISLPSPSDTDLSPIDSGLGDGPKINVIKPGLSKPIPPPSTPIASPPVRRPRQTDPNPDLSNPPKPIDSTTFEVPDVDTTQAETKDPKAKYAPKPIYPKNAKRAEKEGKVMLQATIGIDGIPKDIVAVTKLGFGFEEAAIAALKKWKFIPAKKKGKDVELRINIPIEFKLED